MAADAPLPPEIPVEWIEIVDPSTSEAELPFVDAELVEPTVINSQ